MSQGGVIDLLREYTFPRGALVALLFSVAVLLRLPAVGLAVAVHLLERTTDRLMAVINRIPAQPVRKETSR
ncbi:hypothetical protein A8924_1528 [Saccharopolyspora erythraea NRRL 2338]|uniref:Uncharacterized protein n=2 Tax=Saccharopolyspora erythraea TaxID=1836 RepID=A4F8T7_SACEN|nr:hypothetical protein [Saccharopolyspora erythraea]EQD86784.1 hypothetical protein N599_07970 [Saccharopolyspora erythraea D]PFG94257.1 hypothetical protein A8924_1528 [Saccharopolyspora erythraea NRRL 2338]QRK91029.1 hypothetical protein JQX30_06185 [Saccharopolyspora erythraea]CAM00462.1 hypothetical protein SACE_1131 [Saccharopolyspora erythraea NRRL 2338]